MNTLPFAARRSMEMPAMDMSSRAWAAAERAR